MVFVARQTFTVKGYADASLEDIANEAGLTRGAVYHHFGSKKKLFQAALEAVQSEAEQREELWEQLLAGCRAFIAAAVEPQNRRIMLIDGPAVVGWDQWRLMDERNSMSLLHGQLRLMQERGYFQDVSVEALTHVLSGALNEAALWIAETKDSPHSPEDAMKVVSLLLNGFKNNQ